MMMFKKQEMSVWTERSCGKWLWLKLALQMNVRERQQHQFSLNYC